MLQISYAGGLGISPAISSQFTPEMCAEAKNCKKIIEIPYFGCSRSFKVIDVDKIEKPVSSACYDEQHIWTNLQPFSQ